MKRSFYIFLLFLLTAAAFKTLGKQEERKCLSKHETIAILEQINQENGELQAKFKILKYSNYEQHADLGERKQDFFEICDKTEISPYIINMIKETAAGDTVYLSFRHDSVKSDEKTFPGRVITHYKRK